MIANEILVGSAHDELKKLPAGSVNCCVTSPPYWGLRDYGLPETIFGGLPGCEHVWNEIRKPSANGAWDAMVGASKNLHSATRRVTVSTSCVKCEAWRGQLGLEPDPALYVAHLVEIFRQVRRILRNDGTIWVNLGDCWATGAGSARIPGGKYGKQARAVDGSGYPTCQPNRMPIDGLKSKDMVGIPWRVAFALQADGWYLRSDVIWEKPNVIPESVKDRPTKAHEYIFLLSKSKRYYYDGDSIREPMVESERTRRLREQRQGLKTVYSMKRDTAHGMHRPGSGGVCRSIEARHRLALLGTRNKRTVWKVSTTPFKGAHFATFPEALVRPCILAGSPPSEVVLDPFAGAGTVPLVALKTDRKFIGIELNAEFAEIAMARLAPFMQRGGPAAAALPR